MDKSQYLKPREYELMVVLVPDQGDEETQAAIDTLQGHITEQDGTIDSIYTDSPWGRRRLAYTVRHQGVDYRDGHYVLTYFTTLPSNIAEIERSLKLDNNVIRYLMLIHDPEMGEKFDESELAAEEAEEGAEAAATEEAPAAESEEKTEASEEAAPTEEATEEEAPAEEATEAGAPAEEATEAEAPAEEATEEEAPAEEATEEEAPAKEAAAEKSEESEEA